MATPAKGYDYVELLRSPATPSELRASAETKRNSHINAMRADMNNAYNAYIDTERLYLDAIAQVNASETVAGKRTAIQAVNSIYTKLIEAERELQSAKYPHRYIRSETIPYKYAVPNGDPDKLITVTRLMCIPSYSHERVVELAAATDTGANAAGGTGLLNAIVSVFQ